MKNRFGFIPIVLPAIVMVLIIGLINLAGPQGAQAQQLVATGDPQLTALTVNTAEVSRLDGSTGISNTSTSYMASVNYEVTSAVVGFTPSNGSATLTLPRRGGSTTTSPTAPVGLDVGDNKFTIKVVDDNNSSNHTTYNLNVKRDLPNVDSLALGRVVYTNDTPPVPDPDGDISAVLVTLEPNPNTGTVADDVALLMSERMFKASLPYDVDSTTIQVDVGEDAAPNDNTVQAAEAMRVAFSGLTLASSTMNTSTGDYDAVVKQLKVGTNNLRITVRGAGGDFSTSNSQTYTVAIERRKPELSALVLEEADATAFDDTDTDEVQSHGSKTMASTTAEGILVGKDVDRIGYIRTTTSYTARVVYGRDSVRVEGTPNAMVKVEYRDATDTIPSTGVMDMDLDRGVNNVTVRAVATDDPREYRDYKIAITRENTPLLTLVLTNPSMTALAANGSTFDPATSTDAFTSVEYGFVSIDVAATANADTMIKLTGGGDVATGTQDLAATTRTLSVGANSFEIMAGVAGNTSTYVLTVTRDEPKPQIRFTVLDGAGIPLGSGPLPLTLDAASRSYDLVNDTDITDDDLLTATDVRVCVADAGDENPGPNDVRVSINGVTVPDCDSYLERELNEVTTNLEFDIDHPGDPTGTLHTVSISRNANSVPVFPANHILRSRTGENGVLAVHNTMITPTVELPMAVSGTGNGALTYELLSVEAGGPSSDLPDGLTQDMPSASGNGKLKMSPSILDSSDRAVFNLILKVSDSDAITGSSDEDTIPFTIIVFRDASLLPDGAVIEPRLGDLRALEVYEDADNDDVRDDDEGRLDPAFSLLIYSYEADVFTDTTEVDFVATASSDATVRLEGNKASDQSTVGGETTHTWEGYKLHIGPGARNTYRVTVEEGDVTRTYTVRVERELAKRPTFDDDSAVKAYYAGIPLSALPASAAMLPEAEGGNGDLVYKLERRRADAPTPKYDFLGLNLAMGEETSTRMLSGTPKLDKSTADLFRESDRSEAYGLYTVNDADADKKASDADTMNIDVKVYRDVTLGSYAVSGRSSGSLGSMSKVYNTNRMYSHETLETYRFNAAHDVTMVTFVANPNGARGEVVSITPADADASTDGHQVSLSKGDNVVTVTVGNGVVRGTHLINIKRPGLQLTGITITEDEDARDNSRLDEEVDLDPDFSRDVYEYTATVETWVRSVQVRATAADPNARVFVNTFEIPEREGYSVVDLEIGETTIVLGASVGTDEPDPRYTVVITRKSSSAPAFDKEADNYTRMEGVDVSMAPCTAIILPKATGGDGTLTYSLVNEEQLPPGLFFNGATREITGTPTLDEGYESDFDLILAVRDSDADTSDADGDTTSFTITITNDRAAVDEACAVDTPDPVLPANQLSSLLVTYTLDGQTDIPATMWSPTAFMPGDGGPYTVSIPFGATDVQVTAVRADDGATISMNSVRIASGVKLDLPPQAEIAVRHPDFTESMVYTLVTERISNTAPTFGGATIDDHIFESGMDIDSMTLPMATGGNRTLTYTLEDHEGNLPDGLMFDASSRELSGRPALVQDADSTLYRMTYMVEDADGQSDTIMFNITVCDPDRASGCEPTPPEPTPTPTDTLTEWRSNDGTSATLTWTPDSGAMYQAAFMVAANAGVTAPSSMDDLDGSTYTLLDANGAATMADYLIPADTNMLEVTGLTAGTTYVYGVISWDGSAWGAWELVNFGQ